MRESKAQIPDNFPQDFFCCAIVLFKGWRQELSLPANFLADHARQQTGRILALQFADLRVHSPPRAGRFESGSAAVQPCMANLGFTWGCAVIDFAIDNQTSAHSATKSDIENRIKLCARSIGCFAERGNVCIIVDKDADPGLLVKPNCQIELRPAFDLV